MIKQYKFYKTVIKTTSNINISKINYTIFQIFFIFCIQRIKIYLFNHFPFNNIKYKIRINHPSYSKALRHHPLRKLLMFFHYRHLPFCTQTPPPSTRRSKNLLNPQFFQSLISKKRPNSRLGLSSTYKMFILLHNLTINPMRICKILLLLPQILNSAFAALNFQ